MVEKKTALIIVDVQNDFCPGGALAVSRGDEVVPVINSLTESGKFDEIIVTQDWHSENHCSFEKWPKHCVKETAGAKLHPDLKIGPDCVFIKKGTEPDKEAYSGFEGTRLKVILEEAGIERVFVCGLATDYCVKATAMDAIKAGFETFVVLDACRGVELQKGDIEKAIEEMKKVGIKFVSSIEI